MHIILLSVLAECLLMFTAFQSYGQTVRITAVGDLMCHSPQFQSAQNGPGEYDFTPVYPIVTAYLQRADLAVGNLETVLAGSTTNYMGYPAFNSPNAYADALKEAGFDILFTANNHSYDQRETGVIRTLDELDKRKLIAIGTHRSQRERDSVVVVERKGIKMAFLGYTDLSNIPIPAGKKYLVNEADTALIRQDIAKVRKAGAEVVIVNMHWGNEYERKPNARQRYLASFLFEAGADVILGEHPHVLQTIERVPLGPANGLKEGLVVYSMGNFISNQQKRYTDAGVMVSFEISRKEGEKKLVINQTEYVPTWVFRGPDRGKTRYLIFPSFLHLYKEFPDFMSYAIPEEVSLLSLAHLLRMKEAFTDSKEIMEAGASGAINAAWKEPPLLPALVPLPFPVGKSSLFGKRLPTGRIQLPENNR